MVSGYYRSAPRFEENEGILVSLTRINEFVFRNYLPVVWKIPKLTLNVE